MNDIKLRITSILVTVAAIIALAGCLTKQPVITQTPVVSTVPQIVVTTNVVTGATGTATNLVTETNLVTQTNIVYTVNTNQIQSIASTIGTVNAVSAPINPYSPLISTVLPWGTSAALAIATGFAAFLNNKKNGIISAIVKGVESAAGDLPDTAPVSVATVKASVQNQASLAGNLADVHAAVQANT